MRGRLAHYRLGQQVVASEWPLPELPDAPADVMADWTIIGSSARGAAGTPYFHHWLAPDGRRWISFGRAGGDYVLRVARHGVFRVSPATRTITCEQPRRVPAFTLRHLLLNQVWPLVLSLDHLVLHAAAVALPQGAILLAGVGGAGKSSMAAALALTGCPLLADDAVVLDGGGGELAYPGYPSVRLWPDAARTLLGADHASSRVAHYTRKRRVDARGLLPLAPGPRPVAAVCLLGGTASAQGIALERLSPLQALVDLVPVTLQMDVTDRERHHRTLQALASVVERVPVFRLARAASLDRLVPLASSLVAALHARLSGSGLKTAG